MRLIDADALKYRDVKVTTNEIDIFGFGDYIVEERKGILQEEIWNAPTIDAVPVVRCKDCVSFHYSGMGGDNGILYCAKGIEMQPTDFCSYGERKDNAR